MQAYRGVAVANSTSGQAILRHSATTAAGDRRQRQVHRRLAQAPGMIGQSVFYGRPDSGVISFGQVKDK